MALYDTPWGRLELPDNEAADLRGQLGDKALKEVKEDSKPAQPAGKVGA